MQLLLLLLLMLLSFSFVARVVCHLAKLTLLRLFPAFCSLDFFFFAKSIHNKQADRFVQGLPFSESKIARQVRRTFFFLFFFALHNLYYHPLSLAP